ncbi:hypothetical protein Tco_0262820, partial [Tanacetum coccineum]
VQQAQLGPNTLTVIETSPQLQNLSITYRKTKNRTRRMGIKIPQSNVLLSVANEAITKEMHNGLGRATTTASSLEAEQDSGNILKTQTKATPSVTPPKIYNAVEYHMGFYFIIHNARYKRTTSKKCRL